MDQAASGMRDVNATSEEMSRLSSQVLELAEDGRERVQETIRGMGDIHQATELVRGAIGSLATSAVQIDDVIGVIDGVADETSLLALNAAIIAAQAGEHGRPFAVVAGEVRGLANRVLESTKAIADLIHTVQQESGEASSAIGRGAESVNRGVGLSSDAGNALEAITRTARENGERIAELVVSVEEQARAVSLVADLMVQLRTGTGQIRRAVDEQGNSVRLLRENANLMGDAAKKVEHATDEQARGTTGIRQNMDSVRESVGQINRALHEHSNACRQVVEALQELHRATDSNEESVTQLDAATSGLQQKADELRHEVARFQI
jgi:methyl-accepting chemotaxis protein